MWYQQESTEIRYKVWVCLGLVDLLYSQIEHLRDMIWHLQNVVWGMMLLLMLLNQNNKQTPCVNIWTQCCICLATYPVPWMSTLQSEIDLCPQRWVNVLLPAHLVAISSIFSLFCHKRTLCSAFSLLSWSNGKCSDAHIQIHEDNVGTHAKLANWLNEMILLSLLGGGGGY